MDDAIDGFVFCNNFLLSFNGGVKMSMPFLPNLCCLSDAMAILVVVPSERICCCWFLPTNFNMLLMMEETLGVEHLFLHQPQPFNSLIASTLYLRMICPSFVAAKNSAMDSPAHTTSADLVHRSCSAVLTNHSPVPTWLPKKCYSVLSSTVTSIIILVITTQH